jgi:hypothetical protein
VAILATTTAAPITSAGRLCRHFTVNVELAIVAFTHNVPALIVLASN